MPQPDISGLAGRQDHVHGAQVIEFKEQLMGTGTETLLCGKRKVYHSGKRKVYHPLAVENV